MNKDELVFIILILSPLTLYGFRKAIGGCK